MNTYIAVAASQSAPNSGSNNNDVPINLGTGAVATGLVIFSVVFTKLSGFVDWKEIGKQFAGTRTSKVLQAENRKGQELEAEIDINQGLSNTISTIATKGMDSTSEITKDLLRLVSGAIQSSSANAQSTQALSRASESQVQATEDLIKATTHNSEALKALKEAIEAIPKETASILEIHAAELRIALDNIDHRIEESNQIKHDGYAAIERAIKLSETRIIEQGSGAIAQLRVDLKDLQKLVTTLKDG